MDIISDMTRQYKSMEEELINKSIVLETRKRDNEETIKQLREEYE